MQIIYICHSNLTSYHMTLQQTESQLSIGRPVVPEWVDEFSELLLDRLPTSVTAEFRELPGIVYVHAGNLLDIADPNSKSDIQDSISKITSVILPGFENLSDPQELDLHRIWAESGGRHGNRLRVSAILADKRIGNGPRDFLVRTEQDAVREYYGEKLSKRHTHWSRGSFPTHRVRLATIRGYTDKIEPSILRKVRHEMPLKFPLAKLGLIST